jgi:hypothetical protein
MNNAKYMSKKLQSRKDRDVEAFAGVRIVCNINLPKQLEKIIL